MSDFTKLALYSKDTSKSAEMVISIQVRQLNPEEYAELFKAARALQQICDKYIAGAPVIRPDETEVEQ